MQANRLKQCDAGDCLFFQWRPDGIVVRVTWVDDNLVIIPPSIVEAEHNIIHCHIKCNDIRNLSEYFRCKIKQKQDMKSIKVT